jgi:uncharacterized protein YfaS (alpha-2-macroglobulin family)
VRLKKLLAGQTDISVLKGKGRFPAHLLLDPWGSYGRLQVKKEGERTITNIVFPGPDQKLGTKDDHIIDDIYSLVRTMSGTGSGFGSGSGRGGMRGRKAKPPQVRIGNAFAKGVGVKVRKRFDETVLWAVGVRTDKKGQAKFPVPLADSITGWRVKLQAVGPQGGVGVSQDRMETFLPVLVEPELPSQLTIGDRYELPVVVANHSGEPRTFHVKASSSSHLKLNKLQHRKVKVPNGATRAVHFWVTATASGKATLKLQLTDARFGKAVDKTEHTLSVEAQGDRRRAITATKIVGSGTVRIPKLTDAAPGSIRARLRTYRGALDQAMDSLEGLLAEPHGCFEQTSSTTYPNLLVLDLLKRHGGSPVAKSRALQYVGRGYQRLIGYEVEGGGFSWFGWKPANLALTAYGLAEFVDMAKVYPVDPDLIKRTRKWLLSKQRKDGSWTPDRHSLHDWSAVQAKSSITAYVAWSLANSGYRGPALRRALAYLRSHSGPLRKSPYLTGLWAHTEALAGSKATALKLARGKSWSADTSIPTPFHSRGRSVRIQGLALRALTLAATGRTKEAEAFTDLLWKERGQSFGWGGTQSTVLALRAMTEVLPAPAKEGTIAVQLGAEKIGELNIAAKSIPAIDLPAGRLTQGLSLKSSSKGSIMADLKVAWSERGLAKKRSNGLDVDLRAREGTHTSGRMMKMAVRVKNTSSRSVAMPTIIVPVPPGFRADNRSLGYLKRDKYVSRWENTGREIRLYLRSLAPNQEVNLAYRLETSVQVDVLQRPARAYAYYERTVAGNSAPLRLQYSRPAPTKTTPER